MKVVALVNRFSTSRVKCWTAKFCDLANVGPYIIMHQLKPIYNCPFKDSNSHPIHTIFVMFASNVSHQHLTGLKYFTIATTSHGPTLPIHAFFAIISSYDNRNSNKTKTS